VLWLSILAIIFFSLWTAFYSGIETGIYVLNRIRLQFRVESGDRLASISQGLIKDSADTISATLIGTNLCVFLATAICTRLCMESFGNYAELASTAILSPILFIFAEVIPKNAFTRASDKLFYPLSPILWASKVLFTPAIVFLRQAVRIISSAAGLRPGPEEVPFTRVKLESFILEGSEEGVISEYQNLMAMNILQINNLKITSSFIPLDKCVMAEGSSTVANLRDIARTSRVTRIPIYEGRKSNVVGVVNIFDLFAPGDEKIELKDAVREALYLNSELNLPSAFLELRKSRSPMGIVVDENKKTLGIITVKDIVEEIVGELSAW